MVHVRERSTRVRPVAGDPLHSVAQIDAPVPCSRSQLVHWLSRPRDRGLIREGFAADLVIFDDARITDKATFDAPHQYAEGFSTVIVNGEMVFADGKMTGAMSGQALHGPGREQK